MSKAIRFFNPSTYYLAHKEEFDKAIQNVLTGGKLVVGVSDEITKFEESFAKFIGTKHCVMTGSGTQSLCLAYKALGIEPGDEVITTSHTFIATIDQIVQLGATPILVDIGDDGLIDPVLIEKAITPRTKAIVPVHLEGKICDMNKILGIASRHGLKVIEDSAQAVGASLNGFRAGSMGHAGCYSFFPAKILGSFGNAGAVCTDDDALAEDMRLRRCNYNIGKNPSEDVGFGWNLEPDAIHAAILNVMMKYLPERIARRSEIAARYDEAFNHLFSLPIHQDGRVYQDYVIRIPVLPLERLGKVGLIAYLEANGVGFLGHNLRPNHKYTALGLDFDLPKTEKYLEEQIRLPCNADMTDEEVSKVISVVKGFYA